MMMMMVRPLYIHECLVDFKSSINGECGTEDAGTGNVRATPPVQGSTTRAPLAGLATVPRRHREEVELGFYPPGVFFKEIKNPKILFEFKRDYIGHTGS